MTILDFCISLNSVQKFLVLLGVVDMCHLLLTLFQLVYNEKSLLIFGLKSSKSGAVSVFNS